MVMTVKIRLLTGDRGEEHDPSACQDSVSLTNVTSQEASLLLREVGNNCPRFTKERICSLSPGCPM